MVRSQYMMLLTRLRQGGGLLRRNLQNTMYRCVIRSPHLGQADVIMDCLLLKTLFIESVCNDVRIIEENVRNVKISSPDVGSEIICITIYMLIGEVCRVVIG